ncbi:MAG: hypothetical protein QM749_19815 [Aquabacterium sp.]
MATHDSSGSAASSAQPHQAGELGVSLASYSDDLKTGANNFMLMLRKVLEIGDETVCRFGSGDGRDYRAIAFEIETSIYANLMGSGKATREGFLRAFSDFLSISMDGFGLPDQWDPLSSTALAYAPQGEAA